MIVNLKSYTHNQVSSFGLGKQKTTTGVVFTSPFIFFINNEN
jgi:hypothetical protein